MKGTRIKTYPHFDAQLSKAEAAELVSNPDRVARHPFYPFLHWERKWSRFAGKKLKPKEKIRKIRYAARRDSYIYSHYREALCPRYENELTRLGLAGCVLAYRRISGKCNIHFAGEAFHIIRQYGGCCAIALDIEDFFENLDHNRIKRGWLRLLGAAGAGAKSRLPDDHHAVFCAITHYSWVERDKAYEALKLIERVKTKSGREGIRYLVSRKDLPIQICTPLDFRKKLANHIKTNEKPWGIPQGSPISDLLANLYMIDFDYELDQFAKALGGRYFRYSDDILIVVPDPNAEWSQIIEKVNSTLKSAAPRLKVKDAKTQVYAYSKTSNGLDQIARNVGPTDGPVGLEYLGLRYDGRRIFLRDRTISGFLRKITRVSERMARNHVLHHPNQTLKELISSFNYNVLFEKFGRVSGFDFDGNEYTAWTFWTYIRRCVRILGPLGSPILRQVNAYKAFARGRVGEAIEHAYNHPPKP